jgi:thiamine-monophosphate kinase
VQSAGRDSATRVTRIGCIEEQPGLRLIGPDGAAMAPRWTSFDHFAAA